MDNEERKELFERKYAELLGQSFDDWYENGPQNEEQAYARCIEIDKELNSTYDEWYEAEGDEKERLEVYREQLKAEYDFIEEAFNLEHEDRKY